MATHTHTPSNASRRHTLFAAAGAVILGSGIEAGGAASVADYMPSQASEPDRELISACAAFNDLERAVQAVSGAGVGIDEKRQE